MFNSDKYLGHNLVFIVGCPRSGTTWLQRLLASHPYVRTGQESDLFDTYIGPQLRAWHKELNTESGIQREVGIACYFREEEFLGILKEYMTKLLKPMVNDLQEGEIFLEKTPSHALYISEIKELLPECRIIHILRDPRDVVASLLSSSKSWGSSWAPKKAKTAIKIWMNHVKGARVAAKQLPQEQFFEVRYEELQASTLYVLKDVCNFLKLEWEEKDMLKAIDENCPDVVRKGGGTKIPLGGEFAKKQGVFVKEPGGFIRKAVSGSWKNDLSRLEKIHIWRKARSLMKEVGYNWTFPW